MPKIVSPETLDELVALIASIPAGVGIDELMAAMEGKISRRTLQRRLAALVDQGRIAQQREWRAVKYRLAPITALSKATLPGIEASAEAAVYVPTSPEGEEIKAYVRQPK